MTAGAAGEPLYGRADELQVVAGLVGGLAEGAGSSRRPSGPKLGITSRSQLHAANGILTTAL